ncbi:MAG: putative ArsR family transcriptional regulator [Candidatus Promineifilaceae bacterium]|jgi:predicted ArsR family transcriptional regulator
MAKEKTKEPNKRGKEYKTRKAIIDILKQEGPQDSQTLANRLEVTAMAIRQHLYSLQNEKLLTFTEVARPKGRPAKMWELTPAANKFFPDGNSELLVDMIDLIGNIYGEDGLEKLIQTRSKNQLTQYQQQLNPADSLREKLKTVAKIRTEEGYMAEIQAREDGSFLLIENHCPICAAAQTCRKFCSAEQTLFKKLLGPEVSINRSEHILEGERRCVYVVNPLS